MRFKYYVKTAPPDAGVNQVIDNFISLSYTKRLNEAGFATLVLPREHVAASNLDLDSFALFFRGQTHDAVGVDYYQDFDGIWRGNIRETTTSGRKTVTLYIPSSLSLIAREIVAFKAGVANRSSWSSKTVAQIWSDVLTYNFIAPDVQRLLNFTNLAGGTVDRISFDAAPAGPTIDYNAAYRNCLSVLQELADIGDFHFHARSNAAISLGGIIDDYQVIQVGVNPGDDRSATVTFALERANLVSVDLDERRINEPTKMIVGGQGDGTSRTVNVRTSSEYDEINHTEMFIDARDVSTSTGLDAKGDAKLVETAYKPRFTFRASQSPGCYYGRDYFLGDLVYARYEDTGFTQRIVGVTVAVDEDGKEAIELDLDDA